MNQDQEDVCLFATRHVDAGFSPPAAFSCVRKITTDAAENVIKRALCQHTAFDLAFETFDLNKFCVF